MADARFSAKKTMLTFQPRKLFKKLSSWRVGKRAIGGKPAIVLFTLLGLVCFTTFNGWAQTEILKQFSQGLEKETEGDFISAIFIYQDVLAKNRHFLDAKIALARCYYKTGNLSESELLLQQALKQDRKNVTVFNLLGKVYISLKRYDDAEKALSRALDLEPVRIETRYGLADLYRAKGEHKKAVEIYNEILKIYPQEVWTYIHLGSAYTEMGQIEKAGGFFRKAVSLNSQSPWTHVNLARHYYKMGIKHSYTKPDSASEFFDAAVYEADTALSIEKNLDEAYRILSSTALYRKDYDAAIDAYQGLLSLGEEGSIIYYELGFSHEMLGNLEEAKQAYTKALLKRIDDEVSRFRLENILLVLYKENLSHKERIELSDFRFSKSRYYFNKNIMQKAFLQCKRAIQLDPLSPAKRLMLAELLRVQGYSELYLFELKNIIRDTLDVNTIDINDRIEIYDNLTSKNLASRWKVRQYEEAETSSFSIPKTKARTAVFDSFRMDYLRETFVHKRLSKTYKEMLSYMLSYYPKIEAVDVDDEIHTPSQALKKARDLKLDYYITGAIEEEEDALKVSADLHSALNGKVMEHFETYFTGNDKVFHSVVSLSQEINRFLPLQGLIVRLEGDRALTNLGKAHGVEKDMRFQIVREGGLKRDAETGEFFIDPTVVLGELIIKEMDERVSEGIYTYSGTYNRVNVYDNILLIEDTETKKE